MNRLLSKVIAVLLIFNMCIPTFAVAQSEVSDEFWCSDVQKLHEMVSVADPFADYFLEEAVVYNYNLHFREGMNSEIELSFTIPNTLVTVSAQGELVLTSLTSDLTLAEAHLYATEDIGDSEVEFNIAFIKILEREGAMITATVTSDNSDDCVLLSFGEAVLKGDIMPFIPGFNSTESMSITDLNDDFGIMPAAASSYTSTTEGFKDNSSLTAQTMFYKKDAAGRINVIARSDRNNAASLALSKSSFQNALAQIESVQISLARKTGNAFISGIERLSVNDTKIQTAYLDLVMSVLSDLGVPTSTISTLTNQMVGTSIEVTHRTDETFVLWESSNGLPDLDSSGFPVTFQVSSNVSGTTSFTAATNISYKVYVYNRGQDGRWFYFDANQASKTFSWTK